MDYNNAHNEVRSKNIFKALNEMHEPFFKADGLGVKFDGLGSVLDSENKHVFPILRGEESTTSSKGENNFSNV